MNGLVNLSETVGFQVHHCSFQKNKLINSRKEGKKIGRTKNQNASEWE